MSCSKINLWILLLMATSFCLHGQDFSISNQRSTRKIKKTDFIQMRLGELDDKQMACCPSKKLEGKIINLTPDSIQMIMKSLMIIRDFRIKNQIIDMNLFHNDTTTFALHEIISMERYKSEKKINTKNYLFTTGVILMMSGAATSLNALIFQPNRSRNLLIAGGAQMAAGLVFSLAIKPDIFHFKGTKYPWKFN